MFWIYFLFVLVRVCGVSSLVLDTRSALTLTCPQHDLLDRVLPRKPVIVYGNFTCSTDIGWTLLVDPNREYRYDSFHTEDTVPFVSPYETYDYAPFALNPYDLYPLNFTVDTIFALNRSDMPNGVFVLYFDGDTRVSYTQIFEDDGSCSPQQYFEITNHTPFRGTFARMIDLNMLRIQTGIIFTSNTVYHMSWSVVSALSESIVTVCISYDESPTPQCMFAENPDYTFHTSKGGIAMFNEGEPLYTVYFTALYGQLVESTQDVADLHSVKPLLSKTPAFRLSVNPSVIMGHYIYA